jgi:hypothetical protein
MPGLISSAVSGKIANANFTLHTKCVAWPSVTCWQRDVKQVLRLIGARDVFILVLAAISSTDSYTDSQPDSGYG